METKISVLRKKQAFLYHASVFNFIQLLVLSFIISACDSNGPESSQHSKTSSDITNDSSSARNASMDSIEVIKHEFISDESPLKIRIEYPEIKGLSDTAIQSKINRRLTEIFLETAKADDDDLEEEGDMQTTYAVHLQSKGILSIAYTTYEFYSEASHPWKNYFSLTIHLKRGKDIFPEDLFINDYKEKISSLLQTQEDALNKSGTLFTAANKEDLSTFCISHDGFIFYLKGSSEAEGTKEFKIPFEDLKENIHPDFARLFF